MPRGERRRRARRSGGGVLALCLLCAAALAGNAQAAAPTITATFASGVQSGTARLNAKVNPGGLATTYRFDYITNAAYEANIAASKEAFTGAGRAPLSSELSIGSGGTAVSVQLLVSQLAAATTYRYRALARNSAGTTFGTAFAFHTRSAGIAPVLADGRGWELVSPAEKNGGQVDPPETLAGGGVLQAAAQGGQLTYSSAASFAGGQGAPPASQYIAIRGAGGWSSENITVPIFSASFDTAEGGVPYRLFSADLSRALLLNGDHCRGAGEGCAVANPPLAGTGAPEGYQDYYLRNGEGAFESLLTSAEVAAVPGGPAHLDLLFAGATPDLAHVVLSSCAALAAGATEAAFGEGCDPAAQNLYEYSGAGLTLINRLPGESTGTPGAVLAASAGAISADGQRVYFTQAEGAPLYLREGAQTKLLPETSGGDATFEAASTDASVAFFTEGAHLYRYAAAGAGTSTDLTPAGGVSGVLGADAAGNTVYYQDAAGLERWHAGATSTVAAGAQAALASDFPPATGTARVTADGAELLFLSKAPLTGYDNADQKTEEPESQAFLYDAGTGLTCVSCNPTGGRPTGPSSIPGAIANGSGLLSTDSYKPRVLSSNGQRVFFDSDDAIALTDTNNDTDAYEWEAQGEGSCTQPGGCVSLLSSGRESEGAAFADASADGSDAFFLTSASLVGTDPGARDLYDARIGGGFAEPVPPLSCEGDACQVLPPEPGDPTLTTLQPGPGNPPLRYAGGKKKKGHHRKKGRTKQAQPHRKRGQGR